MARTLSIFIAAGVLLMAASFVATAQSKPVFFDSTAMEASPALG